TADVHQPKLADTGGVDQLAAVGKVKQPRGGGSVGALAGQLRQGADANVHARQQAVDQRRLAHSGLADKHADVVVQRRLQGLHAVALVGGDFLHRIAELAVGGQQAFHVRRVLGVQQVGLV